MDYEKKYKEALNRASKLKVQNPFDTVSQMMEYIFPNLKESEGEGIREKLINTFEFYNQAMDSPYLLGVHKKDIIAWLEKQGEYKTNYCKPEVDLSNCSEEYRKAYYDGYNKCNRDWQRQGEQKQPKELTNSEFVEKCKGLSRLEQHILALVPTRPIDAIKVDARTVRYLVEQEQGEQKPADTPKFKVEKGEWYICTQTFVLRGENVVIKGQVYKSNQNGAIEGENQHLFIDTLDGKASDYFRPWTIKDAKDGDVLVDVYGNIGIFEQYDDFDWTSYYSLGVNGGFQHFKVEHENEKTYPATKEQREKLEKAISDAGYEWDSEHKQLKKIDDEEYNGEDYGSDGLYHAQNILERTLGKVKGYQTDDGIIDHKCAITAVRKLYKQKPATWSEEDKKMLDKIIDDFGDGETSNILQEQWLKSLKEKYIWKPSKEQMDCLNSILRFGYVSQNSYKHLNSLINDLKKLRGD